MGRFYISNEYDKIVDSDGELASIHFQDKVDFDELCIFLNKQEMEKLEYKRRLNTLKHQIKGVLENVWNSNSKFRWII